MAKPLLIGSCAGLVIGAFLAFASPSLAAGGGAHGGFGGNSAGHMSNQGNANTNGPNAPDRDTGLDRAQDRMSQQGLEHNKALDRDTDGQAPDNDQNGKNGKDKNRRK